MMEVVCFVLPQPFTQMMTIHAKIATCPSEVWKMYITSSLFFGQHGDVIQSFTDSPAIADRLTTTNA